MGSMPDNSAAAARPCWFLLVVSCWSSKARGMGSNSSAGKKKLVSLFMVLLCSDE